MQTPISTRTENKEFVHRHRTTGEELGRYNVTREIDTYATDNGDLFEVVRVTRRDKITPEESAAEESAPEVTRYNGTRTDHLGFTKDYYTTTLQGVTYEVRRSVHPDRGTGYVVKGKDDFGETYSVHHGTDLGRAVIAKVQADTAA